MFLARFSKLNTIRLLISTSLYSYSQGATAFKQEKDNQDLKQQIIKASLLYVNKLGWNQKAIAAGCVDLDISSASHSLLTSGPQELIDYIMSEWNSKALQEIQKKDLTQMKTREKIIEAIKIRLSLQIPYLNRWNEAMAVGVLPNNVSSIHSLLWKYADEIWFLLGDRSSDLDFYSKRYMFLSAYIATELFLLTDRSPNYQETWQFLERRIDDILQLGWTANYMKKFATSAFKGVVDISTAFREGPGNFASDMEELKRKYFSGGNKN